jgi:hypothetical protein
MSNDDKVNVAIRMIKAGQKDVARAVLEPFLLENPHHIQAWIWETELFSSDLEKIKVLEAGLKQNPGNPQMVQALAFLRQRAGLSQPPVAPAPRPPAYSPPPPVYPEPGPAAYRPPAANTPAPPVSPFSAPLKWETEAEDALATLRPSETESYFSESPQPTGGFFNENSDSSQGLFNDDLFAEESPSAPPSSAAAPRKAPAQKKPVRLSPQMRQLILVALGGLVCLAFVGFYLLGGYYFNGLIAQAFAGRNCAEVLQQGIFISLYPEGLFGSQFTGYGQYDQCRLKQGVDQAAAAKNWGGALALAEAYLTAYPEGVFAADLGPQAPQFLSTWAAELLANQNPLEAISKLKLLLKTYPASQPAQAAPETIFQAYLAWSQKLIEAQNYKAAELPLKEALAYFEADPARAEQIKQTLVNLYVAWGDQQIQLGAVENGTAAYQKADEVSPGAVDVDLLVAKAYLQSALKTSEAKNFNKALAKVKEVAEAAQADNIKIEAEFTRQQILEAYSKSTAPQASEQLAAALTLTCQGQRPELPIFGLNPEKIRFGFSNTLAPLPPDWTAETPGELHYVACATETEAKIETCKYTNGFSLTRMRYVWQMTLFDMSTGEKVATENIHGEDPNACPSRANFLVGSSVSRSYGSRPTADDLVAWLKQLNLTQ